MNPRYWSGLCALVCALSACSDKTSTDPTSKAEEREPHLAEGFLFTASGGVATAANAVHALDIRVSVDGADIGMGDGSLLLQTTGYGRLRTRPIQRPSAVRTSGERAVLVRGGLEEYLVNGPSGLEHGFVVAERLRGEGPLVFDVSVNGMQASAGKNAIVLRREGRPVLRYDRLKVWDAERRPLRAHLGVDGAAMRITVVDDGATYPITVDPTLSRISQASAADSQADDRFGESVDLAGDFIVVGAPSDDEGATNSGAAFVYQKINGAWLEVGKVVPQDPSADKQFGASVAFVGQDYVVVGAPGDDTTGTDGGAVYLFNRTTMNWLQRDKFIPDDLGNGFEFGAAVAGGDDFFFVGAPGHLDGPTAAGIVYVYGLDPNIMPPTQPTFASQALLGDPLGHAGERFGAALAHDPAVDLLIVGAPGSNDGAAGRGIALAYTVQTDAANPETAIVAEAGRIVPTDGAAGDAFGSAVGISGGLAIVGSPGNGTSGAAYIFDRHRGGTNAWAQIKKLTDASAGSGANFGTAVSIHGSNAMVGAPDDGAGAAVAFWRDQGGTDSWGLLKRETPPAAGAGAEFGRALDVVVDAVVGAPGEASTGQVHFLTIGGEPVAVGDQFDTGGTGTFTIGSPGVLANDSDPEGNNLSASLVTSVSNGTLTLNADGGFSYTPNGGFEGIDSFVYIANDGTLDSNEATVTILVPAPNQAPIAGNDSATTTKNTPVTIPVLSNDADPERSALTLVSVTDPANGTAAIAGDQVTYTPDTDFSGQDSFTYVVSDGELQTPGTVVITVTTTNQPPTAVNDLVQTSEDTPVTFDPTTNDTDPENDTLSIVSVATPTNGTATRSGNTVTFTPTPNYAGLERFNYTIRDPAGGTSTAQITIGVMAVGDPPVAADDAVTINENASVLIDVLANDTSLDSAMTVDQVGFPTNGTAAIEMNQVRYTPRMGFSGTDTFAYEVVNQANQRDTGLVTVTVLGVNDTPVFVAPTPISAIRGTAGDTIAFRVQATDADGDPVTYGVQNMPAGATINPMTGQFSWATGPANAGNNVLTFTASDGNTTATRDVTVILAFNDADGDGVSDDWENANGLDTTTPDSDGDNITDLDEVGPSLSNPYDTDNDQILDALEDDSDADGILDVDEAGDDDLATEPVDTDGDGTPDVRDTDSDDDGTEDSTDTCPLVANPGQQDLDGDGRGDACDTDADGDGIPDMREAEFGLDPLLTDTDSDNIADGEELGPLDAPIDTDMDMTIDALDDDSDGDGVPDVDEAGDDDPRTRAVDTDGDSLADFRDTDSDNDGVEDGTDNCRLTPNVSQSDTDANGVGDACDAPIDDDMDDDGVSDGSDNCPMTANPDQTDTDGDGDGDACDDDDDGDGVLDDDDNCPLDANEDQADQDEDGTGDACQPSGPPDADGDGVPDDDDNCPDDANPDQADEDEDGLGDECEETTIPPGGGGGDKRGCCRVVSGQSQSGHATLLGLVALLFLRRRRR